jgi:hypothetical protein
MKLPARSRLGVLMVASLLGAALGCGAGARRIGAPPVATGDKLVAVPGVFWDGAAIDGPVGYYFVQTLSHGGQLFGWLAPGPPVERHGAFHQPDAIAVSSRHVYWIDDAGDVRRIPRLPTL